MTAAKPPTPPERVDRERLQPAQAGEHTRRGRGFLVAVLTFVLGFAVVTQIRQTREQGLETLREAELIGILDTVNQRMTRLDEEVNALTRTRDELAGGQQAGPSAVAAARQRVAALEVLAGSAPATGPGITVRITDAHRGLGPPTFLDAISELRDAGAEAIQINSVRVVASTAITAGTDDRIRVGGTRIDQPYTIIAIGDAQTLAGAMGIPGGVIESVRQRGVGIAVTPGSTVAVRALHPARPPRYAQPVPRATGDSTP